jgi:hypothetical protein
MERDGALHSGRQRRGRDKRFGKALPILGRELDDGGCGLTSMYCTAFAAQYYPVSLGAPQEKRRYHEESSQG